MSLSVSTSRLSNWTTTRSTIVARSIGAMSMSGAAVTSMPPEWIDRWRGKPSIRAQNSSQRSQWDRPTVEPPRACGGGSGSIRATELEFAGVGGASHIDGRPRRSVLRGGGSGMPSGQVHRDARRRRRPEDPVAGPATRPEPGHARRRVARAALVVGRPPRRIAGHRRERIRAADRRLDYQPPWSSLERRTAGGSRPRSMLGRRLPVRWASLPNCLDNGPRTALPPPRLVSAPRRWIRV